MQGRRHTHIFPLLLVLLLVGLLPLSANQSVEPRSLHQASLWVLENEGISRFDSDTGEQLLTLPNTRHAVAFALDDATAQIWVLQRRALQGWSFAGELRHEIELDNTPLAHAAVAVDERRGLIWIGRHDRLDQYTRQGEHQLTLPLGDTVTALAVEPETGSLWALAPHALYRFSATGEALPIESQQAPSAENVGVTLAWDTSLQAMWVASEEGLARYGQQGEQQFWLPRKGLQHLVPDGQGMLWVAEARRLQRLQSNGQALLSLDALSATGSQKIVALATVRAGDHHGSDVWVAGNRSISQLNGSGSVLRRFTMSAIRGFGPILAISHYADTTPPTITIDSPMDGAYLNTNQPTIQLQYGDSGIGVNTDSLVLRLNHSPITSDCEAQPQDSSCALQTPLVDGLYRIDADIQDHAGNTGEAEPVFFTIDTLPPEMPGMGLVHISYDEEGRVTIHGEAGAVEPHALLRITNLRTGETITVQVNADGSFSATLAAEPEDKLEIVVIDRASNESEVLSVVVPANGGPLPPDPATVAPPLDPTGHTSLAAATEFLYTGSNPIQRGVAPGTIEARRTAVIRGQVKTRDGQPLPGVTITLQGHPEFGHTLSRTDGLFDMVVNGGGILTLNYEKAGYLPAQRKISTPWQDYVWAEEVALIPLDPNATNITLGAATLQVAQGSVEQDEDGQRQATILFPAGTQAELVMPDGSRQPLTSATVRATEYTVGPNGPQAMPGELPPTSAYTYAVELSLDEAIAVGAKEVRFDRPVNLYVDNFLDFPVGGIVPAGWYDRDKAAWIPSDNGRVIQILAIENGQAVLDVDGSGNPASPEALATLNITEEERSQLAALYPAGKSLWRIPAEHFTPWDYNWPFGPPVGSEPPPNIPPQNDFEDSIDDPVICRGSVIEAENQLLGREQDLTGLPYTLNYRTDRVEGARSYYRLNVTLTTESVLDNLRMVAVSVNVAGQRYYQTFNPDANLAFVFDWDGTDVYGRSLMGTTSAHIRVDYFYDLVYLASGDFARSFGMVSQSGASIGSSGRSNGRSTIAISRSWEADLGLPYDARRMGFGAWGLSNYHYYSQRDKTIYFGTGDRKRINDRISDRQVISLAGRNGNGLGANQIQASETYLNNPVDVVVAPDGSVYIADTGNHMIRRVTPDGVIHRVAGTGYSGYSGDGGPARNARLSSPSSIAIGEDGSVYISDRGNRRIRKINPQGIIETIAGNGSGSFNGDGLPARNTSIGSPEGIFIAADGSIYFADRGNQRIRQIRADGTIVTIAGTSYVIPYNGYTQFRGDGGPATEAWLNSPSSVVVNPEGVVYIADTGNHRIRVVGRDGIIRTVAGNGSRGSSTNGAQATQASLYGPHRLLLDRYGNLYFSDYYRHSWGSPSFSDTIRGNTIKRVMPDGTITTIAGSGQTLDRPFGNLTYFNNTIAADQVVLDMPHGISLDPDGNLYIASIRNHRIFKVTMPQPHLDVSSGQFAIADADRGEYYHFDRYGRHISTVDITTGDMIYEFIHNERGELSQIKRMGHEHAQLSRDGLAQVTSIVSFDGKGTTFAYTSDGYLSMVTGPSGDSHSYGYDTNGLLVSATNPRGESTLYTYDSLGRLVNSLDPIGGGWSLSRYEQDGFQQVSMRSGEDRLRIFNTQRVDSSTLLRSVLLGDELLYEKEIVTTNADIRTQMTRRDGTHVYQRELPDPRFGIRTPYIAEMQIETPNGLQLQITQSNQITLRDTSDSLSLETERRRISVNGITSELYYAHSLRRWSHQSALGRMQQLFLDEVGRPGLYQQGNLAHAAMQYDPRGRLTTLTEGEGADARTTRLSYDTQGNLSVLEDALTRQTQFDYDLAGRVTQQRFPDGREVSYQYDPNGNLTALTPPGRNPHVFEYDAVDQETDYHPPELSGLPTPTRYRYNLDKDLTEVIRPDGQTVNLDYDSGGRLSGMHIARGSYHYSYHPSTGQLSQITAPGGTGLSFTWDGFLPLSTTWNGEISGSVSKTYDNNFWITGRSVNGQSIAFGYDDDGLLTNAGSLTLARDAANGLLTNTALGNVTTTHQHNAFGEPVAVAVDSGTDQAAGFTYERDKLGRITHKTEVVDGQTIEDSYEYDLAGRLVSATRNGVTTTWAYDANGNRTHENGQPIASHDEQDRLVSYAGASYDYTVNGELKSKTASGVTTTFNYDELGNLMQVTLPGDLTIDYIIDGRNRRIGKKVNGTLTQGFLYQDQLNPIAELDGSGNVVTRFIYADKINVPAYMIRDGRTYRIISDHLGSPRLVIDSETGEVAQRNSYDVWGNITEDTNPGFQPFGFAGGIYDQHTGLVRFGARDYDPVTARWTSKDPIRFAGGDANLYGYVLGDPVNWIDPEGLFGLDISAYLGVGGGLSVTIHNGTVEILGRLGVGIGAGISVDPYGTPSPHSNNCGSGYIGTTSIQASAAIGMKPFALGGSYTASTGNAFTTPQGGGFQSVSPAMITPSAAPKFGVGLGVSVGANIGSYSNW